MDDRINIKEFYHGLDIMFRRKNKSETMTYMEDWLKEARMKNDVFGIIAVSNELGGLCRAAGETDRAKKLYAEVLMHLENEGLSNSEHYATALINTGDVYINTRQPKIALKYFLKARAMLTDCGLAGDYRMAALCNNISMVYRDLQEFDKAEEALDVAFNIIKGLPQCRGELATTYINLGELQVRQNKLEMAKESFIAACHIFEEDGGVDVHYSSACAGLGQVMYFKGDNAEAVRYYEKALNLIERDFGRTPYYSLVAQNLEKVKNDMV